MNEYFLEYSPAFAKLAEAITPSGNKDYVD